MQEQGWGIRKVESALRSIRVDDHRFAGGSIMGSMCTEPHRVARDAHALFAETNLGDPEHFPGTARLEAEVMDDIRGLLNAPARAGGRFLTGGTEANLYAMYVAREKTGKTEVILPEHAHFSFEKAAKLLGMRLKWIPSGPDYRADVDRMAKAISKRTALVVGVAGSTELGKVDAISRLARHCQKSKVLLHVDAAFGGYMLPFLPSAPRFAFDVPGVWSVTLDPHKMGQATIPAGILMLRDEADWDHVGVETPYVSTAKQSQLLGTRPGAAVAATWAVHRALGRTGYARAAASCMKVRDDLVERLQRHGYSLVSPPELNVVTFHAKNAAKRMQALDAEGVRVNVIPRFDAIRIVVGPHVTKSSVLRLMTALEATQ